MINAPTFEQWFARLQELAFDAEWTLGKPYEYREYFDDGDSPEKALAEEISHANGDFSINDQYTEEQYAGVTYEH